MQTRHSLIFAVIGLLVLSLARIAHPGGDSAIRTEGDNKAHGSTRAALRYSYRIVKTYPHDIQAFTQGLAYEKNILYEGTGLYGKSTLRETALATGTALKVHKLPEVFFGEGITVFGDKVFQLTWKSKTGFVYGKDSFKLLRTFSYGTEGWGITNDGSRLIMSNGTANLIFMDPKTFEETGRIKVSDDSGPLTGLNELEYIRGKIFANVWPTNRIVIISPLTGRVEAWMDMEVLMRISGGDNINKTLNGIAYDRENDRLFVTGKLWPMIFEIEIVSPDGPPPVTR
jgi:glutamine cyclotransferase